MFEEKNVYFYRKIQGVQNINIIILIGCDLFQVYKLVAKKGEGTFSEVIKAQSLKTNISVAIKCMKSQFTTLEQVNKLREIQALKKLSPHEHIVKLLEVLYDQPSGRLALVFEIMDCNLDEHIKDAGIQQQNSKGRKVPLKSEKIKHFMFQLLKAIDHMHSNGIFHRDIKPLNRENILLLGDHLKLVDLSSCKGIYSRQPYTEYISTRWYWPPECLMTDGYYDYKMDIWGAGCVMFEITTLYPLFPGPSDTQNIGYAKLKGIRSLQKACHLYGDKFPFQGLLNNLYKQSIKQGTGLDQLLQHSSKDCTDLIKLMLTYDPEERISAKQALRHPYFKELREIQLQKLLETSLQSIKLFKKNDESMHQDSKHLDQEQMKKTQYSQSQKILQSPFKIVNVHQNQTNAEQKGGNSMISSDGQGDKAFLPKVPQIHQSKKLQEHNYILYLIFVMTQKVRCNDPKFVVSGRNQIDSIDQKYYIGQNNR